MVGVSVRAARARHGRCAEAGGREGSRHRGGLQKLAKPLCPACEGVVLDASSEEIALTPAIESRDCDHGGHNHLRIRFGHVLSKPLETARFACRCEDLRPMVFRLARKPPALTRLRLKLAVRTEGRSSTLRAFLAIPSLGGLPAFFWQNE